MVMRVERGDMAGAELGHRVLAKLRTQGVTEVFWTVGPKYSPEDVDPVLLDLGARVDRTMDIRGVSATVGRSSPILQRLGFKVHGQQRVLAVRPDAAHAPTDRR